MQPVTQAVKLTWKTKVPVTAAGIVGSFFAARYFFYRPVYKRFPGDKAVSVERSGGGI